jgi:hypothetical protein
MVHDAFVLRHRVQEMTSSFYLGSGVINTLSVSTSEVTGPFMLPEMVDRLAGMLNYFLLYLAGPQRKILKVSGEAWCVQRQACTAQLTQSAHVTMYYAWLVCCNEPCSAQYSALTFC